MSENGKLNGNSNGLMD